MFPRDRCRDRFATLGAAALGCQSAQQIATRTPGQTCVELFRRRRLTHPSYDTRAITIRPATDADVPLVLPMVQRLADLHQSWDARRYPYLPDIGRRYDRWLRSRAMGPRSVFLVAEVAPGKLAGFCVATVEGEIPVYRTEEIG